MATVAVPGTNSRTRREEGTTVFPCGASETLAVAAGVEYAKESVANRGSGERRICKQGARECRAPVGARFAKRRGYRSAGLSPAMSFVVEGCEGESGI
jgi:hypothetical protein